MIHIDADLVKKLVDEQFPHWSHLKIKPVAKGGNDNRTFHLGDDMAVRLPSSEAYAAQVEKEVTWLPRLRSYISLPISVPIAKGQPTSEYPLPWSVNHWLEGDTVGHKPPQDMNQFAVDLALFLNELQCVDITGAPTAGRHNFYRGEDLFVYNDETVMALDKLATVLPTQKLNQIWMNAIGSKWSYEDVWIHGDIAPGNLLVKDGSLCGVIDFGIMGVGDPSCDYAIAWTFFNSESRKIFFETLDCDQNTIDRAKGWALWKALITYDSSNTEVADNATYTIQSILDETANH